MCGIAGIVSFSPKIRPTSEQMAAMCASISHRGPDDESIDIQKTVALGMRRLSVIDPVGGRQPLFNEDSTVRVVFNGEIYNYRSLRDDLKKRGHKFSSAADGEVLVHLWEEYGIDFTNRLNGMFSIALHDLRKNQVVLVRDRLGIKPLFYKTTSEYLVFASEIKALLASRLFEPELDLDALSQFLCWEYVPAPQTMFGGICKLQPGYRMLLDLTTSKASLEQWWDIRGGNGTASARPDTLRPAEWEELIDHTVQRCVQSQLVSDVPLGAFLSGGVDSSLVVSAMGKASSFSIGFDDQSYNETKWAESVARHLGVRHRIEIIQPDIVNLFDHLMNFMEDPIGDFSIFPTYLVSKFAREEVTVALSGDGGDELFGGYETYVAQQRYRLWMRIPGFVRGAATRVVESLKPTSKKKGWVNKAKRFTEGCGYEANLNHTRWRLFLGEVMARQLFTDAVQAQIGAHRHRHIVDLFSRAENLPETERGLYVDLKSYLAENCLAKVDRMSMACSLETRVPLLDHELVEQVFQMPSYLKVHNGHTKILLKRVAARHVPSRCVYRPKEGFSIPIKHWLRRELRPLLEELLSATRLQTEGIFQVSTVERLKREHLQADANHSHLLWSLMVFQDWRRRWKV